MGDLACLRRHDGSVIWQRNILEDFDGRNPPWLISESPLVDGGHLIVTPGGRNAGMVTLDKMSGRTVWVSTELSDQAGYASPIVADVDGVRTVMTLTAEAGVGVRASDGHLMWRYPRVANSTATLRHRSSTTTRCSTPRPMAGRGPARPESGGRGGPRRGDLLHPGPTESPRRRRTRGTATSTAFTTRS